MKADEPGTVPAPAHVERMRLQSLLTQAPAAISERFFRVSGEGRETFPGLGLGLYVSAEIIRRQDGEMWVDSTPGKGSTFCFTLPIKIKGKKKQNKAVRHG